MLAGKQAIAEGEQARQHADRVALVVPLGRLQRLRELALFVHRKIDVFCGSKIILAKTVQKTLVPLPHQELQIIAA